MRHTISYKIGIILLLCCLSLTAFSKNILQTKKHELKQLAHKIYLIKQKLFSAKSKQTNLRTALKHTEIAMGIYSKKIHHTQTEIHKQQKNLIAAEKKLRKYQTLLQIQQQLLAKQVRTAYLFGQRPFVKILLNQENPASFTRNLAYYRYFNQARLDLIYRIKATMQSIQQTLQHIHAQTLRLTKIHQIQFKQKDKLKTEQKNRKAILVKISREINNKNKLLQKLQNDKASLEKVITHINEEKAFGYIPGETFQEMRGKLHWPIQNGKVVQTFGQFSFGGKLRSTGILIKAPEGTPIHAVYPGKIVFADWLHGFGQIVIVQHGTQYMTLYAHLQSLYVKTNASVTPGQVIATVGNTGGQSYSALYFEIRHQRAPLNPLSWLRKR